MAVLALPEEVVTIVAGEGPRALEQLPGIGKSLAETIAGYLPPGTQDQTVAA
jgi:Holliday junction resolvasome RuvABC DNA-binding subunit